MGQRKDGQARGKYTLEFKLEAVRLVKGRQTAGVTAKIFGGAGTDAGIRQPHDVRATLDRGPAATPKVRTMGSLWSADNRGKVSRAACDGLKLLVREICSRPRRPNLKAPGLEKEN